MLIGTVAAALFPTLGVSAALKAAGDEVLPGSGRPFLVASRLGLVTITTLQFYSASLTLLSVADSIRPLMPTVGQRLVALVVLLVASCVIALASSPYFAAQFGEFLAILLYLFTPWTAINLVDFYYVRRGHYSVREIFNPTSVDGDLPGRMPLARPRGGDSPGQDCGPGSRSGRLSGAATPNCPLFELTGSGGPLVALFAAASASQNVVAGTRSCVGNR